MHILDYSGFMFYFYIDIQIQFNNDVLDDYLAHDIFFL